MLAILCVFVRLPIQLNFPPEVSPNASASWMIAQRALQAHPIQGMGTGAWSYAYNQYRPVEINAYPFWNVRFDRSYSTFFTLLATVGIGGMLLWLVLHLGIIVKGYLYIRRKQSEEVWWTFLIIGAGWLALTGVSFVYNFTLAHLMMWWLLTALLAALTSSHANAKVIVHKSLAYFFVQLVLGVSIVLTLLTVGHFVRHTVLQVRYTNTVNGFRSGAISHDQTIVVLQRLHEQEPWHDQYTQAFAEAYLQRALTKMQQKPSQADFVLVRNDVAAAVELMLEARKNHPNNADNTLLLASIYQRIASFTPGAYVHALQAYADVRVLDPANPVIPYSVGQVMLQQAEIEYVGMQVQDEQKKKLAQTAWTQNLQAAVASFQEAIRMKSDYYAAHYQLGVAYERQGRIREAIIEVERALGADNKDAGLAFELALLYYRIGDKAAALSLLEQVAIIQPKNMNAHWYLSVLYEEQRDYDKAIAEVDILLQGDLKENTTILKRRTSLQAARQAGLAPSLRSLPDPIESVNPSLVPPVR